MPGRRLRHRLRRASVDAWAETTGAFLLDSPAGRRWNTLGLRSQNEFFCQTNTVPSGGRVGGAHNAKWHSSTVSKRKSIAAVGESRLGGGDDNVLELLEVAASEGASDGD